MEEDESFSEALHREMKEELGVEVKIGKSYAEHQYKSQSGEDIVHHFYLCEQTGGEFGTGDGPEYQPGSAYEAEGTHDPIWVSLSDLNNITLYPVVIKESVMKKYC